MNINEINIKEIIEEVVRDSGYFLIDFNFRGHDRNRVIEVYIDGKEYINAGDCAGVSRKLNDRLQNIIKPDETYRLDISSPGIDKPLKFFEQFPKHMNKKFDLSYKQNDETRKAEAELIEVRHDEMTFQTKDKKEIIIRFKDIIKAKVLLSFS